ncbi:Nonribosomal peptide synthetase 2 [Diaporthe amygdali]|uniref:Nonribosomal peptide synthetase 2 n=1 Tax=Phomopsis amygdali TaxID=1214568 RepID=UPI0022FE501C|nr:Nonribosomal peptide synthetase 2 [Diaporthe amygdali]KAJ0124870.1 Nonribosomal peptide synthetase 2 [Diaporthe amygdali]
MTSITTCPPPITELRPLHCLQHEASRQEASALATELPHWQSTLSPKPDEETCIKAFVELVSHVVVLEHGEAYCIQQHNRLHGRGFILAQAGRSDFSFIEYRDATGEIPTDFSIGDSNHIDLQKLHLDVPNESEDQNEPALLHRNFEKRVDEHPDRTALDFLVDLESGEKSQLTYQQLENAANALARELVRVQDANAASDASDIKTIAVVMGPCPELYTSYLATLKAGMAFCPIPVDAPEERLDALMADLKPTALLIGASSPASLGTVTGTAPVIRVSSYLSACDNKVERLGEKGRSSVTENDVAYILYTSGTTGLPKGVAVSHISATCTVSALSAHYGFVPTETKPHTTRKPTRWFQGAAPTFDISLFEIFWTLSTGSTLCCAPRHFTLQDINKVVTTLEADITNITPSFATLLDPSSMRALMLGGETLNARVVHDFAQHNPASHDDVVSGPSGIYNGYGPTETAIYCIAQAHVPEGQRGSVLGSPLETCGVVIVDETCTSTLQPVPMGATGELLITGPQVSKIGYLNRPDETSKAFINDNDVDGWGRAYKTGDRARIVWDQSGKPVVEFLGRISDDQVKLSGRRVELGEIESVLMSKVEGVRETISCVWKPENSQPGSERVVNLVITTAGSDFEADILERCKEAAQRHLPDYMRPFKIIHVESLPRTASGKVDRKAASAYVREVLKDQQPKLSSLELTEELEPLAGEDAELEDQLLSMLADILGGNKISAATRLADAGVDSLRAMRLLREIRRRWPDPSKRNLQPSLALLLDSQATVRSVFFPSSSPQSLEESNDTRENRTRARLAKFSSEHLSEVRDKLDVTSEADIEMILPATTQQSQLAISFAMDRTRYISHSVIRLKPEVAAAALKKAVEEVVLEQAIYRSAILPCDDALSPFAQVILTKEAWRRPKSNDGETPQVVHRKTSEPLSVDDAQAWVALAEENISLESQRLYHIQVVENETTPGSDGLLVISIAHCICDGASVEVLMCDIARRYAGLESLQRQSIYEAVLECFSNVDPNTDGLWRESLKGWELEPFGTLSGNNVHSNRSSKSASDCGVVQYKSDLPWQVLEDKSRALGSGASPLAILQASWSLLLHLFSEADTGDVTFGSVISGHLSTTTHAPTFSVVPCRVALPETQTISQLIDGLTKHGKFALGHRHLSWGVFETLPYNTALALQAYPVEDGGLEDDFQAPWTEVRHPVIRYDFPIFVEVFPNDPSSPNRSSFTNMTFKVTYREDALSELSASCVVKQLAALTEIILSSSPDDAISGLPARLPKSLLSAEGTVPQANASTDGQDNHLNILHGQFEAQAIATPSRLALTFYSSLDSPPTSLSYAELDSLANGLALLLREEDVDVIPLCIERSVDLYVAVLAVLKAGSAWCPIDLTSPVARRTSLIARTKSKVLLTNTESWHLVEPCIGSESLEGMRVILVDQHSKPASVKPKPRQSIKSGALSGGDLAYLLWTSGTTGEPKGVMIQHYAAAQAMQDLQIQVEHDPKTEQVRTLQLSAYSFDVFVQDLFYTWGLSGSVISGTRELVLGSFVEFIWKARPTHAHLTPSFGASIAVEEIRGSPLQYVTFIGEKLTEDVAEAWAAPGITTRAYNTYGPAENAVVSTMRRFFGKSRDQAKAANVGFPLTPCTAYVVHEVPVPGSENRRWELVPRYGVGELALGGSQVAKGYLSDPAKTSSRFIQGGPGIDERIYLTGDMVRLNDHGFEFLGRNDDLVKITGIRIELSEISAACASIKDEEDAIEHVETLHLPRPDRENADHKVVVTFVSVKKEGVDQNAIRAQVFKRARDMLPSYMVPGHVVVLSTTMPRTASNKVDRKELQAIYKSSDLQALAGGGAAGDASGQPVEKQQWTDQQLQVLQLLADNFKVAIEPLSPEDSLAALGFSSLQVTKLAWTLRRQLSVQVGVLELMRCELLGELVDVVLSKQQQGGQKQAAQGKGLNGASTAQATEKSWVAATRDLLTKNLRGDMLPPSSFLLPATPMQESLIFETMREPKAYWAHRVFDLSHLDTLDGDRLKAAWTAAASTFDILRTSFVPLAQLDAVVGDGGQSTNGVTWARRQGLQATILQVVRKEAALRWRWLSGDEDQNLARWAQEPELTELSPMHSPWAVTIAEKDRKMMLSVHHALYDYDSSETVLDAVTKFYHQKTSVHDDVIQFERGMELGLLPTTAQRDEAASFWTERLAGLRETAGALNAPFPDLTQSRQKQQQRIIGVKKAVPGFLSSDLPTALPTLLQSAFGCVLASYLEIKAVIFGQTVSQRLLHPDLAHVVGPAIATLPLLVRANAHSAEELWAEMARDSSNLFRVTHNLHPVDIKRLLNEGSGSGDAPFAGVFVYHPASSDDDGAGVVAEQALFREVEQALSLNVEHPLAFNVFEGDGMMELTGDARRISQAQLELMLDQIIDQARVMKQSPQLPLSQLQNKLDGQLVSLSGAIEEITTDTDFDPTESIAQHASQHPDWIAAEEVHTSDDPDDDEDALSTKTITYAQLDRLTNTIAAQLASHEVGLQQDDVVALYLGRDIKSLAATLAIFRAGYIYLPVDEDLPLARKQLLIRDAAAKLVITTEELAKDLDMDHDDPPALLLPESDSDVDFMLQQEQHWSRTRSANGRGHGGYLLYTSGSTGRPKGVRVSNRNLCHFIFSFSLRLTETSTSTVKPEELGGSGRYLNLTSRAFDPHLTQLFVPWHLGYRVVIGNRTALLGNLQHAINNLGITHFGSVPSVLMQLRLRPEDVPSVRVVTTGGEKASNELLDTWTSQESVQHGDGSTAKLINFYGPTEVTIGCLGHVVNRNSNARNLGLPLKGLQALLLAPSSENGEQVIARRGQPGELCIAGPQVALGYLERPDENAKSFQTTSLLGDSEERIYRTGDVMRMMHDGTLEFLGRADQQAKIRGQRLELDEVVSFLKEQAADEGELDFAAAVVAGEGNQQQLFGFVARKARLRSEMDAEVELLQNQGQALTSLLERLGRKCEAKLPAFMVPKLLWVSRIPYLAASGKVDTKLLAKLANDFFASQDAHDEDSDDSGVDVAPSTLSAGEALVVAAVEEVVGHKINGKATSSIRLGIDSLSAVHLVALLRKRGFSKVNVSDILSSSATVASIAQLGDKNRHQISGAGGIQTESTSATNKLKEVEALNLSTALAGQIPAGLVHDNVEAVLPCLPLQAALVARSMVWMSAHDDDSVTKSETTVVPYVAQFNYRLSSGTDLARWQKAAEKVVASEAMLRACFVQREDDGKVFQVVLRSPSSTPFDTQGEVAADIVAKMSTRPPIRIQLREEGNEATVSLRVHHALFDGIAIAVLLKRLEQVYDGVAEQDNVASAHQSLNVLTRVSAHCNLSAVELDSTKTMWQNKLRGVRPCHLGSIDDSKETVRYIRYLPWTLPQIRDKLNSQGAVVSASSAFQVATALCLSQLTKQTTSVVYGFVMSLRPLLDHVVDNGLDEFLGPCLNTLVQAFSLRKDEIFLEFAQRVHQLHIDACQGTMPLVSVEQVQRWAGSEDKLFDSLLSINVLPAIDESESRPGRMSALQTRSRSDMALAFDVDLHHDGKILLTLSSAGVLTESDLDEVGQLFEKAVGTFVSADKELRVGDLLSVDVDATAAAHDGINDGDVGSRIDSSHGGSDAEFEAALASVHTKLCRLLRLNPSDLNKDKTTSLYQVGLDSITVLPFVRLLNKSEKVKLTPDAVLKARTIHGTARLLQQAKANASTTTRRQEQDVTNENDSDETKYDKTLARLARDLLFVATPLQEGMLSASLATSGKAYTYDHTVQLSEEALQADTPTLDHFFAAVKDTVQACEILRTRFIFTGDDEAPWVGIVSPTEQSDLANWTALGKGKIQLRISHALYDATSIQTVWRILGENYYRRLNGQQITGSETEARRHEFRPFAKAVATMQRTSVEFWADLLRDYKYIPREFSEGLSASSAFHFNISEEELSLLQSRCKAVGVTTKTVLMLAWAKVLSEFLYGQPDVVYGQVVTSGHEVETVVGPTINTVPVRVTLNREASVAEGLAHVQRLSDEALGANSMASLRKVQTLWRSSAEARGEDLPSSLFQSLFVFDGVVGHNPGHEEVGDSKSLFRPVHEQDDKGDERATYDDYHLITSFQIQNNTLRGKLRARMAKEEVETLGSHLETAVRSLISDDLQKSALDLGRMEITKKTITITDTKGTVSKPEAHAPTAKANSVLEIVKSVLGKRCKGKDIDYNTKLINVGLDSILAIRLSSLLRKRLRMTVSVFQIMKGARVHDIVIANPAKAPEAERQHEVENKIVQSAARPRAFNLRQQAKLLSMAAERLGLSENLVQSVLPVLAGQRAHLEQWLYNGRRFFEAPWVYRVVDTLDKQTVESCWAQLCRIHDVLRTTFLQTEVADAGLVQVTMSGQWSPPGGFTARQDSTTLIQTLIEDYVREGNNKPSDLKQPPAYLTLLEGADGKAVVLRLHHALYDAWSIKMIIKDLDELLAGGDVQGGTPLSNVVTQIMATREPGAEDSYWSTHLANAQDTLLGAQTDSTEAQEVKSPLGPHLQVKYADVIPQATVDKHLQINGKTGMSSAIILAYARTLRNFTQRSRPTFGLNHAARSLSSVDEAQTLDLTDASVPTMTTTPFSLNLDAPSSGKDLIDLVQGHLAQLTKFAQSDDTQKFCPRFNTHINILYPGNDADADEEKVGDSGLKALQRYRLDERLASEYFTITQPSGSSTSTIEGLNTDHLSPHRFFFNVIVRDGISVAASGDEALFGGDRAVVTRMIDDFATELAKILEHA